MSDAIVRPGGALVTDATRRRGREGDGRPAPDSSYGIYGTRPNLNPNSGFEVDTRYWTATFAGLTRDTIRARFGTASGKATVTTSGQTVIVRTNGAVVGAPLAQDTYATAVSLWAEGNVIGKTALVFLFESGGAQAAAVTGGGATTSRVLTAGWNDIVYAGAMAQADRTELQCRVQITGLLAGDVFWVDAAPIWRGQLAPAYVEASEALVEFAPSPDIGNNGSFEAGISPWFGGSATVSQDTIHARVGTKSLKIVTTVAGTPFAQHQTFITGAPLAVTRYAVAGWFWAEGSVVGKTGRISLTEAGGAQALAAIVNVDKTLEAGWNYILAHGIPVQADRTAIRVLTTLLSGEVGDTWWVDDLRGGAGYVVPPAVTVTRPAGRLRVPTTGMSAAAGWVALRIRPDWSSHSYGQADRPAMPVTLWQWKQDAANYVRLTFDGSYLIVERAAGGVADTARTPWAVVKGTEATVVGAWDTSGTYASVEGRPFTARRETVASDGFERADGALGSTAVGGLAWTAAGASSPGIVGGRLEPHATNTGNGYAYLTLPGGEKPHRWGGQVGYVGVDAGLNTTMAWEDPGDVALNTMLHMLFDRDHWAYQTREAGVWDLLIPIGRSFATAATDGTPRPQFLAVDGDTMAVEQPDGVFVSFKHPKVATLQFPRIFFEVHRAVGGDRSRWDSVMIERRAVWPPGGGHVPAITADLADIGSAGDGAGHLAGAVLWVAAGSGTPTDADAAAIAAGAGSPPTSLTAATVTVRWNAEAGSFSRIVLARPAPRFVRR